MSTFDAFSAGFFALFTQPQFKGSDFRRYLERPAPRRSGDEASIVDNAIVGPLLSLLGFAPGEQVYNQNNKNGRPDFAPRVADYGDCFVVEDKSTGLELTLRRRRPGKPSGATVRVSARVRAARRVADERQAADGVAVR